MYDNNPANADDELATAPFPGPLGTVAHDGERPDGLAGFLRHLADAQPLITADPDNKGDPPARYVIGRELGAGAVAQVIEAHDEHLGRDVAIKVMPANGALTRERIARFLVEAQITAQLEHPAVPPVYEIGQMPGGLPYFAMRLVQGESLDDLINNLRVGDDAHSRRYTVVARARLFLRICQGMAYAHAKGVVHRDLKPGNILLGRYGEVQIMDWGLAKIVAPASRPSALADLSAAADQRAHPSTLRLPRPPPVHVLRTGRGTDDGEVAGTPAYMSPEQARGRNTQVGPPADVYALGLILAELVTLVRVRRPVATGAGSAAGRFSRPVEAAELNPRVAIDDGMAELIRTATQPAPEHRYPHAGALEQALRGYLERNFRSSLMAASPFASGPDGASPVAAAAPEAAVAIRRRGRLRRLAAFLAVFLAGWGGIHLLTILAAWLRRLLAD